MWNLPTAIRIARALEEFDTFWHEDPIKMDSLADLRTYAEASRAPVCASETLAYRSSFRELLETRPTGVVMLDLSWCGGLSEAKKIATMAEAYHLPVAPHDCTGPVVLAASPTSPATSPNALVQEIGPRLLHRLVQGAGDGAARGARRHDRAAARAGARARPAAGHRAAAGRQRAVERGGVAARARSGPHSLGLSTIVTNLSPGGRGRTGLAPPAHARVATQAWPLASLCPGRTCSALTGTLPFYRF